MLLEQVDRRTDLGFFKFKSLLCICGGGGAMGECGLSPGLCGEGWLESGHLKFLFFSWVFLGRNDMGVTEEGARTDARVVSSSGH